MTNGLVAKLDELIALKRYAKRINYKTPTKAMYGGEVDSSLRGRGVDFAEARIYQAGDDIRHMEWGMTARTGRPHVKLYQEERERPVVILCDFNPSMYFGTRLAFKSVVAARLSAMIAWVAIKQRDKVGGLLYSATKHKEFIPRAHERAMLPFLAALSQYTDLSFAKEDKMTYLSEVLLRVKRVIRPGSILVIISDFYGFDAASLNYLTRLSIHNDVLIFHICDPLELAPPKPSCYPITDGKEELLLDLRKETIINNYRNYCEERIVNLKTSFKHCSLPYTQVTAEINIPHLVRRTFLRRAHG